MSKSTPAETPRTPGRAATPTPKQPPKRAPYVQVHAHRGGAALAPENTMAAFHRSADLGVPWFELDIRRCASGELIVFHDRTLERIAGSPDDVTAMPWSALRTVDVGSHFGPEFAGERIPLLEEVVETFRHRVRLNIEIKEDGTGDGTATGLAQLIERMGLAGECIVSSFNPLSLLRVKLACSVPLGLIYPSDGKRKRERLLRRPWPAPLLSVYALHPSHKVVTADLVRKAHLRGLAVNTWTVNTEERMRELIGLRVNALITDRPDLALDLVAELDPFAGSAP